ncbi:MAG: methyltransferase [Verrucomicrobia bacterium]|nr:methyltransferase [Verrucomicrobiota bacterium]
MMTSRERVQRCLEFDRPDRVPRQLWSTPIGRLQHGAEGMAAFERRWPNDIAWSICPTTAPSQLGQGDPYSIGRYRDEWGCVFENIQDGVMGEVKQPILDDWSKLEDIRPPYAALDFDIEAINDYCARSDLFLLGGKAEPFQRMQFLRGTESLLLDLAEQPAELQELLKIVHAFHCRELEIWSRTRVNALFVGDDWGSQNSLLISPQLWRRLFKPLYTNYARIARNAGKKLFMHSDGFILDIYEDLIEIGVDAINSQLFCMNIEEIGRRFKGRIAFWGEMDRQYVLPFGTLDEVRAAVHRIVKNLYRPEGGVIAQFEMTGSAKLENAEAVFQAWDEFPLTTDQRLR